MEPRRLYRLAGTLLACCLVAACAGRPASPPAAPDTVATRVAQELAVSATLTALASRPEVTPPTASIPPSVNAPAATPTRLEVTILALPLERADPAPTRLQVTIQPLATPTGLVLTLAPPIIRPPLPVILTPVPTRIQVTVLPVDGSDGNQNLRNNRTVNSGRNVLVPGNVAYGAGDTASFRDRIVFQVEVFDRTVGQQDGAGIESVAFTITDETGQEVHTRTETTPGFCVFGGGEPDCIVWRFSEHGGQWPGGASLQPGVHGVQIFIKPKNGAAVTWFWSFRIDG